MPDRVQPGVKIDDRLWEQFRNAVRERKGGVRGHVRSELETAIRLYIGDDAEVSAVQLNRRLGRIESELGIAEADGGADTFEADGHAHAPSGYDPDTDGKPAANASTDKKVQYLAHEVERLNNGHDPDMIPREKLRDIVKTEYGFRSDTAKRYVERLIDHFDLVKDPREGYEPLVSPERHDELLEQRRQELEAEADAGLDKTQGANK